MVNTKTIKRMVLEFMSGLMAELTSVTGLKVNKMMREFMSYLMEL